MKRIQQAIQILENRGYTLIIKNDSDTIFIYTHPIVRVGIILTTILFPIEENPETKESIYNNEVTEMFLEARKTSTGTNLEKRTTCYIICDELPQYYEKYEENLYILLIRVISELDELRSIPSNLIDKKYESVILDKNIDITFSTRKCFIPFRDGFLLNPFKHINYLSMEFRKLLWKPENTKVYFPRLTEDTERYFRYVAGWYISNTSIIKE